MRRAFWLVSLVWLNFVWLIAPGDARAQLAAKDSLRILDQARSAQSHFERFRRDHLPKIGPSARHECEVTVGRMCYWIEDDSETPIVEPAAIADARGKLINTLDRLSEMSRADDWISGQRVRYLVESGDDSAAVVAARECWSAKWWCNALRGYALHAGTRYDDAAAAYDTALAAMPHDVRCRWTDISLLLDDDARDRYDKLPCEERDVMERRFWELAQPSYMIRANDRRTEHFSRELLADLSTSSANTYGLSWGTDLRELLIRYGSPLWYASSWPTSITGDIETPTGHDRHPSYHFAATITNDDSVHWDIYAKRAPERYSPPYLDTLVDLDAQFALMKRGDSALVVVVYADSLNSGNAVLGVSGDSSSITVGPDTVSHIRVRRAYTAWKREGMIAGVETYDVAKHRAARARVWLTPPISAAGAPALSTLLLFAADTDIAVESLNDALAHALTANELRGTRKLGLYWEMYGPQSTTSEPDVAITVVRTDRGVLRWLAQALHIEPRHSPLAIRWHDAHVGDTIAMRSVVLDLAQLPAGTYRITLSTGPDDTHRTMTSREIRLR